MHNTRPLYRVTRSPPSASEWSSKRKHTRQARITFYTTKAGNSTDTDLRWQHRSGRTAPASKRLCTTHLVWAAICAAGWSEKRNQRSNQNIEGRYDSLTGGRSCKTLLPTVSSKLVFCFSHRCEGHFFWLVAELKFVFPLQFIVGITEPIFQKKIGRDNRGRSTERERTIGWSYPLGTLLLNDAAIGTKGRLVSIFKVGAPFPALCFVSNKNNFRQMRKDSSSITVFPSLFIFRLFALDSGDSIGNKIKETVWNGTLEFPLLRQLSKPSLVCTMQIEELALLVWMSVVSAQF